MLAGERKETESTIPQDFLTGSDTERRANQRAPTLSPLYLRCSFVLRFELKEGENRSKGFGSHLGAWLMRGWALYLGNLWDLNSSMEDIPGQLSSVGVPAVEGEGG